MGGILSMLEPQPFADRATGELRRAGRFGTHILDSKPDSPLLPPVAVSAAMPSIATPPPRCDRGAVVGVEWAGGTRCHQLFRASVSPIGFVVGWLLLFSQPGIRGFGVVTATGQRWGLWHRPTTTPPRRVGPR
jgi:hypothetical protein